jgi:signal transduction histidine kinase
LLVSQLLLLAESDANRLKIHAQRLDLSQVVQRAAATFGPAAESLGIRVYVSTLPAMVQGNKHHLQQVVSNLLDNALKFTSASGRIGISLDVDARSKEAVLVVSDSGVGIAAEELPLVFDRFYRGEHARYGQARERGAGLGLSICKSIVEAHHGTIQVASTPSAGSTFTVRLPLAVGAREQPAANAAAVR